MTLTKNTLMIIAASVAGLFVLLLVILFATLSSTKSTGVDKETALSAQYDANRVYLSGYITGFYEQTGLAKAKTDKLNDILLASVKGRYEGGQGAGSGPFGGDSQVALNVIQEAYPNLSHLDIYDKITDYVQAKRQGYVDLQTKLRDQLADYDRFRNRGLVHPTIVKIVGVPSENLEAQVSGQTLTGAEAETQMKRLVLAQAATDAYETGVDKPLTPGQ